MTTNNRSCIEVMNKIIDIIPENENIYTEINDYKNSLWNIAPECLYSGYHWKILHNILIKYLSNKSSDEDLNDWEKKMWNIYLGKLT